VSGVSSASVSCLVRLGSLLFSSHLHVGPLISCVSQWSLKEQNVPEPWLTLTKWACQWHCTSRTFTINSGLGHPKRSVADNWEKLLIAPLWVRVDPVSHELSFVALCGSPRPPTCPPPLTSLPRSFRGPTSRLALTSGHQPTLRDVANHHSANAVGRKNKGAAWGTGGTALF